jgi:CheY-like chemotaxis protein
VEQPSHGTTVSWNNRLLSLPFADDTVPRVFEVPAAFVDIEFAGTVFVAEDEVELLKIAHQYLVQMDYSVLLTDIIMPGGMNGAELAEKAQKLNSNLRVIHSS